MSEHFPVLVGEWCLSAPTPRSFGLPVDEHRALYRDFYRRISKAWGAGHWAGPCSTDKHSDESPKMQVWGLMKSIELGYLHDRGGAAR